MAKKRSASLARGGLRKKNAQHTKKNNIGFTDIPELTDEQLRKAKRVGRPNTGMAKQLIAFRMAPSLIAQFKKLADVQGKPYQTLMHEILEKAIKRRAA